MVRAPSAIPISPPACDPAVETVPLVVTFEMTAPAEAVAARSPTVFPVRVIEAEMFKFWTVPVRVENKPAFAVPE
jgi:hypothetical protein